MGIIQERPAVAPQQAVVRTVKGAESVVKVEEKAHEPLKEESVEPLVVEPGPVEKAVEPVAESAPAVVTEKKKSARGRKPNAKPMKP